jgi:hypothetical protein
MRSFLNDLNFSNLSIESYPIVGIEFSQVASSTAAAKITKKVKPLETWLDLCSELFCFQVVNPPVFIRISYNSIVSMNVLPDKANHLQVRFVFSYLFILFLLLPNS